MGAGVRRIRPARCPAEEELARRIKNTAVNERGGRLMTELDLLAELPKILSPTLVCDGSADPLATTAADEILDGLRPGVGRLEVIEVPAISSGSTRPTASSR